jgi:uncharacterized protein
MTQQFEQRRDAKIIACVVIAFAMYYVSSKIFFHALQNVIFAIVTNHVFAFVIAYLAIGLPLFIAARILNRGKPFFESLGFKGSPWRALLFAVICTIPMFAGYAYMAGGLAAGLSFTVLVTNNLLAGVFEETYFRGFLFGQLFRGTRLGFLPAIIFCSVLFASGHLYQSTDPKVLFGILCTTFLGSILFAWLYVEWGYNIWVPMFLHSLMDTSWYIFDTSANALGGVGANVFRLITVLLAIALTVIQKRRSKQPFFVNRQTIWKDVAGDGGRLASDAAS